MINAIKLMMIIGVLGLWSCKSSTDKSDEYLNDTDGVADINRVNIVELPISIAELDASLTELLSLSIEKNAIPRTEDDGEMVWASKYNDAGNLKFDWTIGFFPGSCWYMYELTGDPKWKDAAIHFQSQFESFKSYTGNHDLGFVFHCSYGNGYRLQQDEVYKKILIEAGNSLITRFNPKVGCIQSWNVDGGWQSKRDWKFPVIIDNMMNLEMLFELTELTGDQKYRDVAISHADATIKNHFREDNSSYHVVDYDPETGAVRKKETAQGYSDESAWSRGQAWGLYGYTVCYRYTKDQKYLLQAEAIADFMLNHPNLPEDGVAYWDFNAPNIPHAPRDVSAAAILTSALIELDKYSEKDYSSVWSHIFNTMSTDKYFARKNVETKFLLKHSVGSIPHGAEIDEPLVYADYYFLEAFQRLTKPEKMRLTQSQ